MVIVLFNWEEDEQGRRRFVASHGIDSHTLKNVCVPAEEPAVLGAVFDKQLGEYVLRNGL